MFIETKSKPQWVICLQIVSVPKDYNLKRHYKTRHKNRHKQHEGEARVAVLQDLKSKYNKQISCMTNFTKTNLSDKKASYEVSLILSKNEKLSETGKQ